MEKVVMPTPPPPPSALCCPLSPSPADATLKKKLADRWPWIASVQPSNNYSKQLIPQVFLRKL